MKAIIEKASTFLREFREMRADPAVDIDLRYRDTADNEDFYRSYTRKHYKEATRRHPKMPLIRDKQYGLALCEPGKDFDAYFASLDGQARRNFRKAIKLGYSFEKIDVNEHLDDVREINMSTDTRQGRPVPERLREGKVNRFTHPPSKTHLHDYPIYGIIKDGKLYAYCSMFVAGDGAFVERIYGHAKYQADGFMHLLLVSIAKDIMTRYPEAKYYVYGKYYGGGEDFRRFLRRFRFMPHRANWILG